MEGKRSFPIARYCGVAVRRERGPPNALRRAELAPLLWLWRMKSRAAEQAPLYEGRQQERVSQYGNSIRRHRLFFLPFKGRTEVGMVL
jgi:hypothetical protein